MLVGCPYKKETNKTVSAVVISPYDPILKERFLMLYLMLNSATEALDVDYAGTLYSVLVLSGSVSDQQMEHEALHDWLRMNGPAVTPTEIEKYTLP